MSTVESRSYPPMARCFHSRQARSGSLGCWRLAYSISLAVRKWIGPSVVAWICCLALDFGDDGAPHHLPDRIAGEHGAMAAQQHQAVGAERPRQALALRRRADVEVAVVVDGADVEHRRALAQEGRAAHHRAQPGVAVAERDEARGVIVQHRHHVGARLVDFAMDHALEEQPGLAQPHRIVVEIAGDDVGRGDQRRRHAARDPIMLRMGVIARADMPVGVEHAVVGEDAVGRHQIIQQGRIGRARHRIRDLGAHICAHSRRSGLVGWRKAAHELVRQQAAAGFVVETAPRDADQPRHPLRPDQAIEHAVGLVLERRLIERAGRIAGRRHHQLAPGTAVAQHHLDLGRPFLWIVLRQRRLGHDLHLGLETQHRRVDRRIAPGLGAIDVIEAVRIAGQQGELAGGAHQRGGAHLRPVP